MQQPLVLGGNSALLSLSCEPVPQAQTSYWTKERWLQTRSFVPSQNVVRLSDYDWGLVAVGAPLLVREVSLSVDLLPVGEEVGQLDWPVDPVSVELQTVWTGGQAHQRPPTWLHQTPCSRHGD